MSTIQAMALNDILQAEVGNLTAEMKLSLAEEVARVGFKRNHAAMLLQTLGSGCSVGLGCSRRAQQDYANPVGAYPHVSWDILLSDHASDSEKFETIATIAMLLGLPPIGW